MVSTIHKNIFTQPICLPFICFASTLQENSCSAASLFSLLLLDFPFSFVICFVVEQELLQNYAKPFFSNQISFLYIFHSFCFVSCMFFFVLLLLSYFNLIVYEFYVVFVCSFCFHALSILITIYWNVSLTFWIGLLSFVWFLSQGWNPKRKIKKNVYALKKRERRVQNNSETKNAQNWQSLKWKLC